MSKVDISTEEMIALMGARIIDKEEYGCEVCGSFLNVEHFGEVMHVAAGWYCAVCYSDAFMEAYRSRYKQVRSKNYVQAFGQNLADRDGGWICQYCKCKLTVENRTVDHLRPLASYPWQDETDLDGMVLSCRKCNSKKGTQSIDPETLTMMTNRGQIHWTIPPLIIRGTANAR